MIMEKLYYTDPLASAYMAREFGVELINEDGHKYYVRNIITMHNLGKLYIHPDSYHIFEPQVGDVFSTTRADATSVEFVMSDIRATEFKHLIITQGAKIIQRNNKPFFWPEGGV